MPRAKFRFAVGTTERVSSSLWFVSVKGSCVYLGARTLGGTLKATFHSSGESHVRFGNADCLGEIADHRVVGWNRKAIPETGLLHAATVIFPTDMLRGRIVPPASSRETTLIEPAPAGSAVEIGLFYFREPQTVVEKRLEGAALPLFYSILDNGDGVVIAVRSARFDATNVGPLGKLLNDQDVRMPAPLWENPNLDHTRLGGVSGVIWNDPRESGVLAVIQMTGLQLERTPPAA